LLPIVLNHRTIADVERKSASAIIGAKEAQPLVTG